MASSCARNTKLVEGNGSLGARTCADRVGEANVSLGCRRHSGGMVARLELELTLRFHTVRVKGREGNGSGMEMVRSRMSKELRRQITHEENSGLALKLSVTHGHGRGDC